MTLKNVSKCETFQTIHNILFTSELNTDNNERCLRTLFKHFGIDTTKGGFNPCGNLVILEKLTTDLLVSQKEILETLSGRHINISDDPIKIVRSILLKFSIGFERKQKGKCKKTIGFTLTDRYGIWSNMKEEI